ncbi:MAG TPA: hypothetical protein VEN81_04175 [Planctomycetota bacterium]|nr:hypothetical protein [Planctomycetota bacterium]
MTQGAGPGTAVDRVAPIFIIADNDQRAVAGITMSLGSQWFYIPVSHGDDVVRYAKEFTTTGIFLAEQLPCPEGFGGIEHLLQVLLDEVGKPVIILSELWNQDLVRRWKQLGAEDCIPHPTRTDERLNIMKRKMRELILAQAG